MQSHYSTSSSSCWLVQREMGPGSSLTWAGDIIGGSSPQLRKFDMAKGGALAAMGCFGEADWMRDV